MGSVQYISIFVFALNIILGITILAHDPRARINQAFFLIALSFSFWVFSNLMVDVSQNNSILLMWSRLTIIAPFFSAPLFVFFAFRFPKQSPRISSLDSFWFLVMLLTAIGSLFFINTPFNIQKAQLTDGAPAFTLGALYSILLAQLLSSLFLSLHIFAKKMKILEKKEKGQVFLVFFGILVATLTGIVTNALLVFNNIDNMASLGPIFSVLVTIFTAYSIIRYTTFKINIVATEVFIIIILSILSFGIMIARNSLEVIIISALFILVVLLSFFLLRSIIIESDRRRQIQDLANQLENANQELKKLSRLKDDFIHIAVHEINTPMASILGYLSLILDERITKIDSKAEKYLSRIYSSSKRLSNIVSNFLDIVKIEGGKLRLEKTESNLGGIIQEILSEYEEKALSKNNSLVFESMIDSPIEIRIDKDKIKESLLNLVDNAIKFTNNGTIKITLARQQEWVSISIQDSGIGISQENIERVFEKFYRIGDDNNGTGLGLYMARLIIELHNGKISAKSTEGMGTEFIVYLPLSE